MNVNPLLFLFTILIFSNGISQTLDSIAAAGPKPANLIITANQARDTIRDSALTDSTLSDLDNDTSADFEAEDTIPEDSSAMSRLKVDTALVTRAADTGIERKSDSAIAARLDSARLAEKKVRPSWLYSGISLEQDTLARQLLSSFCEFNWTNADKTAKKMQRLEKKDRLPPLSYLLQVGIRIMRIQRGEYEDDRAKKAMVHDVEKLARKGLELAGPVSIPDSLTAINKFIAGGITGFVATLEIDDNPVKAAMDGFSAQKLLQEAAQRDTVIKDVYLGLGLFNCMLAKAPFIVRSALSMVGKDVSLLKGLYFLRKAAYHGRYTSDIARMFLIEFLSPFLGDEAEEKKRVLRSLQKKYPENPYYVFLELDENICFHPDDFFAFSPAGRVNRQIARFNRSDYSTRRYTNLVKWQYLLTDPFPSAGLAPDTSFSLRDFSYYPLFLRAFKEKYLYEKETGLNKRDRDRRLRFIREEGLKACRMIETSQTMPAGIKNYYLWHIRDGLRIKKPDSNPRLKAVASPSR